MAEIVVLDGYTENPGDLSWAGLEELGHVTVYDRTPEALIAERMAGAEIVLTNKTPITRETLASCKTLKMIGVLATGFNVVDINAAREMGVDVCNIPTYGTDAVAQFAVALLLEICHHIGAHSLSVQQGCWERCEDWCYWNYPLIELAGKTAGVIGFGRIGRRTAQIVSALGMKVLACDQYHGNKPDDVQWAEMDEIFARSDVIFLHCPMTDDTAGLVNRSNIAKMKDGVILINNSRGGLIAEEDLAQALKDGKIAAAGLDVVSTEPIRKENPLLKAPNVIITPHIAWASRESRQRLMDIAVDNVKAFLANAPQNVVN